MEHRIVSQTGSGFCLVKVCSCGERYLVIGRACLKMNEKNLALLAEVMASWKKDKADQDLLPVLTAAAMEPWKGPGAEKEPRFN